MRQLGWVVAVLAAFNACEGCDVNTCMPSDPMCGNPTTKPTATIVVDQSSPIIGKTLTGKTNSSGCKKVLQMQVLIDGNFAKEVSSANNAAFTLEPSFFVPYYTTKGIQTSVALQSKVVCDDGRTNESIPQTVTVFPAANVTHLPNDEQAAPDTFIAEGGANGVPTTFLGCVGGTGTGLARVDTGGNAVVNYGLPIDCTADLTILDRPANLSLSRNIRWAMQPDVGVFAFESKSGLPGDLAVTSFFRGKVKYAVQAKDGYAIAIADTEGRSVMYRIDPLPVNAPDQGIRYQLPLPLGSPNAAPVVSVDTNELWESMYILSSTGMSATINVFKHRYLTGELIDLSGKELWSFQTDIINTPIQNKGAFSADGRIYYLPVFGTNAMGNISTFVWACSTSANRCEGAARPWSTPELPGLLPVVVPYGSTVAVSGAYSTYFVDTMTGRLKSNDPVLPSGTLNVFGVTQGKTTDFYSLNGPQNGIPTEIVAIQDPSKGPIWRLEYGTGTGNSGLWAAIDEGGKVWLRVGIEIVQPLTNRDYCMKVSPPSGCL